MGAYTFNPAMYVERLDRFFTASPAASDRTVSEGEQPGT
jgi:hypothetical protein